MSVEAVHVKLICVLLTTVGLRFVGAVGGVVSASVVALTGLEGELRFPAASVATI